MPRSLFAVGRQPGPAVASGLWICAFLLPLALWSCVSYIPWIWHPLILVEDAGGSDLGVGTRIEPAAFRAAAAAAVAAGVPPPRGSPANPVFLPEPHRVATALVTSFSTPPLRRGDPWMHESLWHSITIIAWGFLISCLIGVPIGILCGAIPALSRLVEPFMDFIRYMPAPAFGALCVAVLGINDGPKIAIIVIGTLFQMVLVIANTTRQLDRGLIEAARTLGAGDRSLLARVVVPGILPGLYSDLRVLLGWAWTYLIVAELIGAASGISWFINQQGKYRNYENVYAGIIIIGMIGLVTDQILAWIGRFLFPWTGAAPSRPSQAIFLVLTFPLWGPWRGAGWLLRQARIHHPAYRGPR